MLRLSIALGFAVLLMTPCVHADEKDDKLEALKKTVMDNWKKVDGGAEALASTEHLVLIGPKDSESKLKEHGAFLEKHFDLAFKALYKEKDVPVKSRIAVYLLEKPEQMEAFLRRIEKRRPRRLENGSFSATDVMLHVVAVRREMTDPPVEIQAAQQLASLLLQRRAGPSTILPYWLLSGFGRATYYRVDNKHRVVVQERQAATRYLQQNKSRNASDVWNGTVEGDEAGILESSLADFFAYGPGRTKFPALIEAFRPGENEEKKSMDQAMQTVELKADMINKVFRQWVIRPN